MNEQAFETVFNEIFEKSCESEYIPNSLENYKLFRERKKLGFSKEAISQTQDIFKGIFLFSCLANHNARINDLLTKFLSLNFYQKNPKGNTIDEFGESLLEHHLFDLADSDFEELMQIAEQAEKMHNFQEAVWMYHSLTALFPKRLEGWLKWGTLTSSHFFDYQKVLGIYINCLKLFEHPLIHLSLGVCYLRANHFPEAVEQFHQCIDNCDKCNEIELKRQATELLAELESLSLP